MSTTFFKSRFLLKTIFERCQTFIEEVAKSRPDIVKKETIAKTIVSELAKMLMLRIKLLQQGRKLEMLTITENSDEEHNEDDGGKEEKKLKRIVMVMARQHPGESPSSYVVQGESCDKQMNFVTQIFFRFDRFSGFQT